ncbi:MAG: tyrosine-type recombinase/integrase [Bdellovibrionota bacterium]
MKALKPVPEIITKYLKYMDNIESASPLTLKAYKNDLFQFFEDLSQFPGDEELLQWCHHRVSIWNGLGPASRNRKVACLKSFFRWTYEVEMIHGRNLGTSLTSPKVPHHLPHFISVDEAFALLRSFPAPDKATSSELQEKVLFCLLYGSGLRVSEACAIKWSDISESESTARIRGKGQKERLVIIPRLTLQCLAVWKKSVLEKTVFVFGEKAMNPRKAYELIKQRGIKAGLFHPLHPHALRHSFATHLLSSGANLRTLQELLGHANLQATQKYTHVAIDQLARTMDSFHPLNGVVASNKK